MDVFEAHKRAALASLEGHDDRSRKGSVDAPIVGLVGRINAHPDYVTTSSCSGRIAVYREADGVRKFGGEWIVVTHDPVDPDGFARDMVTAEREGRLGVAPEGDRTSCTTYDSASVTTVFRFEPFVLHCECRTLEGAQGLFRTALAAGFKQSGVVLGKRAIVAVRSTLKLEVPLACNGRLLVTPDYLRFIASMANDKMRENVERINRLETALAAYFDGADQKLERKKDKRGREHAGRGRGAVNADGEGSDPQVASEGTSVAPAETAVDDHAGAFPWGDAE